MNISITSLDQGLTKILEPRTSSPAARLRAMEELTKAGIPTRALFSPIIPGLNDSEIPKLAEAVSKTGVRSSRSALLRLPGVVQPVFLNWLRENIPSKAEMIESRVRQTRNQELHDPAFGRRMTGVGVMAQQIQQTFKVFAKKHGLDADLPEFNFDDFRKPEQGDIQRRLF